MAETSVRDLSLERSESRLASKPPSGLTFGAVMEPGGKVAAALAAPADKHSQSWTDCVFGTLQLIKDDAEASATAVGHVATEVGHQGKLLAEGVVTGAILNPINGTTELLNHAVGTHISELQFSNQKEVDDSIAGKIGTVVGAVADYAALSMATGGLAGAAGLTGVTAEMASLGAAGALSGGVFSPTGDTDSNAHFFEARAEGLAIGGAAALAGSAAGRMLSGIAAPIENGVLRNTVAIGGGAILGGSMAAGTTEVTSVALTGKGASASDLLWATGIGAFTGAISSIPDSKADIDESSERQPSRAPAGKHFAEKLPAAGKSTDHSSDRLSSRNTASTTNPIHVSTNGDLVPRDVRPGDSFKPQGLWYSNNNEWSSTMGSSMPELKGAQQFQLDLKNANILDISTRSGLDALISRYGVPPSPESVDRAMKYSTAPRDTLVRTKTEIDWNGVAKDYDGINFSNVNGHSMWKAISNNFWHDDRPDWFKALDIDSGVVWNASKVKVQPVK